MNRSLRRLASVLVLTIALVAIVPSAALAKSYTMPEVAIRGDVLPNGDVDVYEARTFDFDGEFTQVYWQIPTGQTDGIEIVGVKQVSPVNREMTPTDDPAAMETRPDGTYLVVDTGSAVEVHAFHQTADQQAAFVLLYKVRGGAKRYSDTGELYWQAIGPGWDVGVGDVTIDIRPPAELTKADVQAWAHGPLTGVVTINDTGLVNLKVTDLPPSTFVEARVLYPAEALAEAPVIDQPRKQSVMDEEAALANEANAERTKARILVGGVWSGAVLLSVGGLLFAWWAWRKHGKEFKTQFQGQYYREDPRPELHPAVVGALWRFGTVNDTDIAATLMELADKGVVRMAPVTVEKEGLFGGEEQTFTLERVPSNAHKAAPLDTALIDILFNDVAGGRSSFALSELKTYAKAHPQSFSESIKAWKSQAEAQADSLGFFDGDSFGWQIMLYLAAAFVGAVGVFGAVWIGSFIPAVLCVPSAVGMAAFATFMKRRSAEGNELYRTYAAVRDFLKDFSRLEEAPPSSVILWNRFLVLAVVFGIAEEVIAQLRVKMPDVVADPTFQTSYWWVYAGAYGHSPVSDLSSSFVSASQVASSQMSSSSGGGGGFSGGGGGGFGGGGGGAN